MIPPVVSQDFLAEHPEAVLVDVRWYLDGRSGPDAYANGHLPGAVFVDLNEHLAGPPSPESGRHPLPTPDVFAQGMRLAGVHDDSLVVAYDDLGGAQAARLVWLLRLLGHDAAVLDGGLDAWTGELETGFHRPAAGTFTAKQWIPADLATIDDAATNPLVIDARAPQRYRGETEPVDAQAGHIPGALNAPFTDNLEADMTFRHPAMLAERFAALGITDATAVVAYCGSGVTACHNLIALEYAGLGRGRLYPGSWSQYAATGRPVATGAEPGQRPAIDPHGVAHAAQAPIRR